MKKYLKRLTGLTLALLMVFTLVSYQEVSADESPNAGCFNVTNTETGETLTSGDNGFTYDGASSLKKITISSDGNYTITQVCKDHDATDHADYQIVISGTVDVELTINNVQIQRASGSSSDAPMYISGAANVKLILEGENIFDNSANNSLVTNTSAGIYFSGSGSLEITTVKDSNATLIAKGGDSGAGIGSTSGTANITISGGTVYAQGGGGAAGIGGGSSGQYGIYLSTDITISGGNVTAIGGTGAAGIGNGIDDRSPYAEDIQPLITIKGGTVTAISGGSDAYGIGNGSGTNYTSTIVITGGSVKALDSDGKEDSISSTPTNGSEDVYLYKITDTEVTNISDIDTITVDQDTADQGTYTRSGSHYVSTGDYTDGAFYLYVTQGEDLELMVGNSEYRAVWDSTLESFTLKECRTPEATFTATDDDSGILSNLSSTNMLYSVDGGSWDSIAAGTSADITFSGTGSHVIEVKYEDEDNYYSHTQTITVTQASAPNAVSNTDGTITINGYDSSLQYEYSTDGSEWNDIDGDSKTGLTTGTYYVRVKANETTLASPSTTVAVVHTHSYSSNPTWTWNEDYTEVTATFECDKCESTEVVTATISNGSIVSSTTGSGEVTYTATVELDGETYTTYYTVTASSSTGSTTPDSSSSDGSTDSTSGDSGDSTGSSAPSTGPTTQDSSSSDSTGSSVIIVNTSTK